MQMREFRIRSEIGFLISVCLAGLCSRFATEQELPIAIVPVGTAHVSGNLVIAGGKASIIKSGSVTASTEPVLVALPHRGDLKICATTTVGLMTDSSVPAAPSEDGDENARGLMLTFDRGALEASFATVKNSDLILTPDFRILISGPGTAQVQVRLGARGDTCVDNRGPNAPYVTVSSVFGGGAYRVQPDQRVMFQRGSLHEVVVLRVPSGGFTISSGQRVSGSAERRIGSVACASAECAGKRCAVGAGDGGFWLRWFEVSFGEGAGSRAACATAASGQA